MPANRSHTPRHARRLVRRILPLLTAQQRGENPAILHTLVRSALWVLVRQEIPPYRRIIQEVESEYNKMNRQDEVARANEQEPVTLGMEPSEQDLSDTDSDDLPDYSSINGPRVPTASSPPSQPISPQPSLPLSSLNSISPSTSTPHTSLSSSSSFSYQAALSLPLSTSPPSSSYQATSSLPLSASTPSSSQQSASSLLLPTPPPEEQVSPALSVPHQESSSTSSAASSSEPSSGPLTQDPLEECTIGAYKAVAVALECGHRFCGHCPAH